MGDLSVYDIIAGVFFGNMFTMVMIVAFRKFSGKDRFSDVPWWALALCFLPLALWLLSDMSRRPDAATLPASWESAVNSIDSQQEMDAFLAGFDDIEQIPPHVRRMVIDRANALGLVGE